MKKKDIASEKNNAKTSKDKISSDSAKYSTSPSSEKNHNFVSIPKEEKISLDTKRERPNESTTNHHPLIQEKKKKNRFLSIGLALVPLVVLAAMIYFLTSPYGQDLITGGTLLPEITIEKIEFHQNQIIAYIRNTGPESVTISQADVNDRIHSAAIEPSQTLPRLGDAKVIIPFLWNPAEPYEIGITTSDGTRFSNTVEAAAPAPVPNINQVSIFAMLGIFVGVIPVLIGLAWYPAMRKITTNQYNFFLSLTAGLLVFLGIEAFFESSEIAATSLAPVFNGQMLIPVVIITTFLGLFFLSEYFIKRAEFNASSASGNSGRSALIRSKSSGQVGDDAGILKNKMSSHDLLKPLALSLLVAIGIGMHNFGEGLAIGAAVLLGEIALSTFLIVGFTIHNTTEGLAIVAPLAKTGKLMIRRLILLGLIAGIPTILGTWIGGFIYSPLASVIFLSVGAGAIFQVVYSLLVWMLKSFKQPIYDEQTTTITTKLSSVNESQNSSESKASNELIQQSVSSNSGVSIIAGFILGMLIMYLTGLFV